MKYNNMTQTNSWEEEIKRICESYTLDAGDFNTDMEDHLIAYIKDVISQEKEKMIEEIKKVYVGYYDRTEGRDDSYDDAFLDGTEVMQKKILDLLQNK